MLRNLQDAGFVIKLVDGNLAIKPLEKLTPTLMRKIKSRKRTLILEISRPVEFDIGFVPIGNLESVDLTDLKIFEPLKQRNLKVELSGNGRLEVYPKINVGKDVENHIKSRVNDIANDILIYLAKQERKNILGSLTIPDNNYPESYYTI